MTQRDDVFARVTTRDVLLVYGNCQAEVIASALQRTAAAELFDIVYLRSFPHPVEGRATLAAEVLDRCAIVWEQRDYQPFPYAGQLPSRSYTIVFPAVDLNVLWPYKCANPYNEPEPPDYPFGRFHYGDRIVIAGIKDGLPANEILERVLNVWSEHPLDLDRLLQIDRARLLARDLHCDIRMGARVLERFRHERCFFTRDHPTLSLLFEVMTLLLERTYAREPRLARVDLEQDVHFSEEPLGEISVPIHPAIAAHFALSWYDSKERCGPRHAQLSYKAYFEAMIRSGLEFANACTR